MGSEVAVGGSVVGSTVAVVVSSVVGSTVPVVSGSVVGEVEVSGVITVVATGAAVEPVAGVVV